MSTNSCAGFIFLLSRLLSLCRHWAACCSCFTVHSSEKVPGWAEQSCARQDSCAATESWRGFFAFLCVLYYTPQKDHLPVSLWTCREEVTSGCSSHCPAQRRPCWAPAVHLCCDREQMVNYFFFPHEGVHLQYCSMEVSLKKLLFQSQLCFCHCR